MKKRTTTIKKEIRTIKTPKLIVPYEHIDKLAAAHKCSRVTVYAALKYGSNSHKAQEIRKDALENFGALQIEEKKFV